MANHQVGSNEYSKALANYEKAVELYRTLPKNDLYTGSLFRTLYDLANLHVKQKEYDEAFEKYEEALGICRAIAKDWLYYFSLLPDILYNIANLHVKREEFDEAFEKYEEALKNFKELFENYSVQKEEDIELFWDNVNPYFNSSLMGILTQLEFLHNKVPYRTRILEMYEVVVDIYSMLAKKDHERYIDNFGDSLYRFHLLSKNGDKYENVLIKYEELLGFYRDLAEQNPEYLNGLAETLIKLADVHKQMGRYNEALVNLEEALGLCQSLEEEHHDMLLEAGILKELAVLQMEMNEFDKALVNFEEVLFTFRAFEEVAPKFNSISIADTLNNLANLHTKREENDKALEKYEEALGIYRELIAENEETLGRFGRETETQLYDALTLCYIANIQIQTEDYDNALANYKEAFEICRINTFMIPTQLFDVAATLRKLGYLQ